MKENELIYTILELEEWCSRKMPCSFCASLSDEDKIVCQIRTRNKITNKLVENAFSCQKCKEKFENNELPKCEKCGRLKTDSNVDFRSGSYVCDCEEEEKELPNLPHERESMTTFYERQINTLREEKNQLAVEAQTHLDAMEAFEVWNKEHKQQLLDKIKELEEKNKKLEDSIPQELLDEISKLKERVKQLEEQLTAQVEVKETKKWPWRLKK